MYNEYSERNALLHVLFEQETTLLRSSQQVVIECQLQNLPFWEIAGAINCHIPMANLP